MARSQKETSDDKIPLMIRLPREMLDEAKAIASADDRTVNSYIVKAVREQNRREKGRKR
jgi:predicted HicB family RNase H-like nuclease